MEKVIVYYKKRVLLKDAKIALTLSAINLSTRFQDAISCNASFASFPSASIVEEQNADTINA
jgi:hypothetical protein